MRADLESVAIGRTPVSFGTNRREENPISHEPEDSDWKGERGFISREHIEKYFPGPDEKDIIIFVCGPPPMYNAFCGPREEKDEIKGILGEMGYKAEQVYKF